MSRVFLDHFEGIQGSSTYALLNYYHQFQNSSAMRMISMDPVKLGVQRGLHLGLIMLLCLLPEQMHEFCEFIKHGLLLATLPAFFALTNCLLL